MNLSTITLNGKSVTVVSLPSSPGLRKVDFSSNDTVGIVKSPFTGQQQAQKWPGADWMNGTATLPPLTQAQADEWISFLLACRGQANAFMLGDPLKEHPRGNLQGSVPVVDGADTANNKAG